MNYMKKFMLQNKTAVVTGGGRGIGLEIARALGQAGAQVVIAELDEKSGVSARDELTSEGIAVRHVRLDVTDSGAVEALAEELSEKGVDVLVNNAGIARSVSALTTTDDDWQATMRVNADAAFWCSRAFGRHMVNRRRGSIVNVGSMCGIIITQPQNNVPYIASKAAVHMMTKSLACAWAPYNVRVNAVAPGYVASEMTEPLKADNPSWYDTWISQTPMGRLADPKEIASAVLFLSSEAASYCTGAILSVDGGYTCQ